MTSLFITNRKLIPKGTALKIDEQDDTPFNDVFFCRRMGAEQYEELGHRKFFTRLKGDARPTEELHTEILLYIHGFNNFPEKDVFPRAEKLQELLDQEAKNKKFIVVPLIWPSSDNHIGIIRDYWDDQIAAEDSSTAFARAFSFFMRWKTESEQEQRPCYKRINILAHSMGNRALLYSVRKWAGHFGGNQFPQIFRNIFMVAADVPNESLESGQKGNLICDAARNVMVYHANDDLSMPASKILNLKNKILSRRLGLSGPENLHKLPRNVYVIDCDNYNNQIDFPKGHSYFLDWNQGEHPKANPVFQHILSALLTGRATPEEKLFVLP